MNYNAPPWFPVPDLPKPAPKAVPKRKCKARNKKVTEDESPPPSPEQRAEASRAHSPPSDLPGQSLNHADALPAELALVLPDEATASPSKGGLSDTKQPQAILVEDEASPKSKPSKRKRKPSRTPSRTTLASSSSRSSTP